MATATLRDMIEAGDLHPGQEYVLVEGPGGATCDPALWIQHEGGHGWTLNDANTSIPLGLDEDLETIRDEWCRVTA